MTKAELIEQISLKNDKLDVATTKFLLNNLLELFEQELANQNRIEIRGFGSFELSIQKPRIGRNPKTGEVLDLKLKKSIHFKPSLEFKNRVDAINL